MKIPRLASFFFLIFLFSKYLTLNPSQASNLTSVKDTLSSSQLSYFARMGAGVTALDSTAKILVGSTNPTNTTNNLFIGDTVSIGATGITSLSTYTVLDIAGTAQFQVSPVVAAINANTNVAIISTRSAIHTLAFTPDASYTNGIFQFLIKASTRVGETYNDGIPDQQGFELGMDVGSTTIGSGTRLKIADIACPLSATASVGTTIIIGSSTYHAVNCTLSGSNSTGVGYTIIVGRDFSAGSQLGNPSPGLNHIEGTTTANGTDTDIYSFYIRHLDSTGDVKSTKQGKIALIEAIRVTATVDPTLTFTIDNIGTTNVGTTRCSAPLSQAVSSTTATSVSFGSLSLNNIAHLAQHLSITTNAANGYIVTTYASTPMTIVGGGVTIPNTSCDDGTCSVSLATGWTGSGTGGTTAKYGFGYSLDAGTTSSGTTLGFSPGTALEAKSKPFGVGSANAATVFQNTSIPSTTDNTYVCYRINVGTLQQAGNYETKINYTATATF